MAYFLVLFGGCIAGLLLYAGYCIGARTRRTRGDSPRAAVRRHPADKREADTETARLKKLLSDVEAYSGGR